MSEVVEQDLSLYHHPLTKVFDVSSNLKQYELSKEQLEFFEKNGYISNIPVLKPEEVDILVADLEKIVNPTPGVKALFHEYNSNESPDPQFCLFHALGAWRVSKAFHDLLWHPAILVAAHQIIQGPVRFWHDQLFCKPPRNGSCVAWHQDYSYWTRTIPNTHLTIHIALDNQTLSNGTLHFIPGSHKWPLLPITSRHFNDMESIKTVLTEEQKQQFHPVPGELKKGQMSIHHSLTVHGSFGNHSDQSRRATVLNFFKDGTVCNVEEPLLDGIPIISKGGKMEGQFFPLLFDGEKVITK